MTRNNMQMRTELLLGAEKLEKIRRTKVLMFGVGGVGSWCAEALVRSGICNLTMVDFDKVCASNCNRQLMATSRTIDQPKVHALRERLLEINPDANIVSIQGQYNSDTADSFHLEEYDFIIDAIDSVADKADLILRVTALPKSVTLISSMGAALRTDPFKVRRTEFWNIKGDPLARALRHRFKKIQEFPKRKFQCIYSEETPMENMGENTENERVNGSLCHITAIFGMSIAGTVINAIGPK